MESEEINPYAEEAKEQWGDTAEYKQYEENSGSKDLKVINAKLMNIFIELGEMKNLPVEDSNVQRKVQSLKDFISTNYYECNNTVLNSLGKMYTENEKFKHNIDRISGDGTAQFVNRAISLYVANQEQ